MGSKLGRASAILSHIKEMQQAERGIEAVGTAKTISQAARPPRVPRSGSIPHGGRITRSRALVPYTGGGPLLNSNKPVNGIMSSLNYALNAYKTAGRRGSATYSGWRGMGNGIGGSLKRGVSKGAESLKQSWDKADTGGKIAMGGIAGGAAIGAAATADLLNPWGLGWND